MDAKQSIPFWNVNLPEQQWTATCPDYLSEVDHWDQAQLAVRDEDYQLMSWQHVSDIVHQNRLQDFTRIPSELHRYRKYIAEVKKSHGSVMNFILNERVQWTDLTPKGDAFELADDRRTLYNDWPYGVDERIVHLVIWVKFGFEEDPQTGDLTPAARKLIDDYVSTTFRAHLDPKHILWFKNWAALKSVHAIEHFHVLLFDPDPAFVKRVTNDDVPASQRTLVAAALDA